MGDDLRQARRVIVGTQTQPPVQPEDERQGAGDQPAIIEMIVEEPPVHIVLDDPAIEGIGGAARQAERVEVITEARHGSQGVENDHPGQRGDGQFQQGNFKHSCFYFSPFAQRINHINSLAAGIKKSGRKQTRSTGGAVSRAQSKSLFNQCAQQSTGIIYCGGRQKKVAFGLGKGIVLPKEIQLGWPG